MANFIEFRLKDLLDDANLKKAYVILSKTKSAFTRGLDEMAALKRTVKSYIDREPSLANKLIKVTSNFPNAFYNTAKDSFVLGLFNADILAHELEHSLNIKDSPNYTKMLMFSKYLANLSAKATLPALMASMAMRGSMEPDTQKNVLNALSIGHGVVNAPLLYEEGKANLNAIVNSPNKFKAISSLIPAYSTYVGKTVLPISMYQLAKRTT